MRAAATCLLLHPVRGRQLPERRRWQVLVSRRVRVRRRRQRHAAAIVAPPVERRWRAAAAAAALCRAALCAERVHEPPAANARARRTRADTRVLHRHLVAASAARRRPAALLEQLSAPPIAAAATPIAAAVETSARRVHLLRALISSSPRRDLLPTPARICCFIFLFTCFY